MSFQVLKNLLNYLQEEEVRMSKSDAECKFTFYELELNLLMLVAALNIGTP